MYYCNARIFTGDRQFHTGGFQVTEDGRFGEILPAQVPENAVDLDGAVVIPGLIDLHCHGAMGVDASDGENLPVMASYLAENGITAFLPTTVTLPYGQLEKAFLHAKALRDCPVPGCARVLGTHMEGPYFAPSKKGAQNAAYLRLPDTAGFTDLYEKTGGILKIADVAPELPGAVDFIRQVSRFCRVGIAHTDAAYEEAVPAFQAGAAQLTHVFNAMSGIGHRAPGVIPAAVENPGVTAELISDGLHLHPAAVRLAFRMFGAGRVILISDSLRCCGLPDGDYELGGQTVTLSGGVARLGDGTIAGSATNLYDCMRRAMSFGIPEETAVAAATCLPAQCIGSDLGVIAPGRTADFLICREGYARKQVFMGGVPLHREVS